MQQVCQPIFYNMKNLLNEGNAPLPKISYGIQISKDYHVIKVNEDITLAEAKKRFPDRIELIKKGTMMSQQDVEFTLDQIIDIKEGGLHYQFGFATAYDKIPFEYLAFTKITKYNI